MEHRPAPTQLIAQAAALARIEEMGQRREEMATETTTQETSAAADVQRAPSDGKAATRAAWALGDYHEFATRTVWELGPRLVEACGISGGQRVLDVAAGTGNTAIRAAEAGAEVIASDLTPENFDPGRREARQRGVELEWVEADAEALPFGDDEFDVVTSSFGAIFAPDHPAVADELIRVCRPGGTIGMLNFTPESLLPKFFEALSQYAPAPPASALPPPLWGSEAHLHELFGERVELVELTRGTYIERAADPRGYVELFKQTFGPVVAMYADLAGDEERTAALDRDFLEFATRENSGPEDGPAEYVWEYLLVVARKHPG